MKSSHHISLRFPVLVVIAAIVAAFGLSACTGTVHQKPVESPQPSMDGNVKDSGIVAQLPDGSFVVTAAYLARYNALIAIYGNAKTADGSPIFTPPLVANAGVEPINPATVLTLYQGRGAYILTAEAEQNMVVLSRLKKKRGETVIGILAQAEVSSNSQVWLGIIGIGVVAALCLNVVQIFRAVNGTDSQRQIEPTAIFAIQDELKAQTRSLSKLDREMGETRAGIHGVDRSITELKAEHKAEVLGMHTRIGGISRELTETRARVDGIEKRESNS